MNEDQERFEQLSDKLSDLKRKNDSFQKEIENLRDEIHQLRIREVEPVQELALAEKPTEDPVIMNVQEQSHEKPEWSVQKEKKHPAIRQNLEKFIGENLINKIGIVILIIGVGIGAKYAIDHRLISPLTRIILGYMLGAGLLGIALWLKRQYINFSAVLLSGAMAILYFITFAAYSFYELIPLTLTFALMVLFTVFTVAAAILYDRQVIAHIGLVGAYAVPFLLSDGSGKVVILFSYMAIINAGILVIAFRKYWKPLCYSSFILTWLIFLTWFIPKYDTAIHFELAWVFIAIFFITFYTIFLAYKLIKTEKFSIEDILLLLANSFVFYGLGYALLNRHTGGEKFLGLFTLCNGLIHFMISILVYRRKQVDKNLFYFTAGLVITFFTIAIPVQLDGNWVTMFWSAEAAILFWIGRTKSSVVYELLSFPVMIMSFFCIALGWPGAYNTFYPLQNGTRFIPLFNINFLTSVLFIASFTFINMLNARKQFTTPMYRQKLLIQVMNFIIPGMLLIVIYFAFLLEINCFWDQLYTSTMISINTSSTGIQKYFNENIRDYKTLSILLYSLLFFSLISFINILKLKKRLLGQINMGFNLAVTGFFLTLGLISLGTLRETYVSQTLSEYFYRGVMIVGIRYFSFLFFAFLLYAMYRYTRQEFLGIDMFMEFDVFLHITILAIASNELINWMNLFHSEHSYKLGLSILFGVYALLMIVLGIWKKKMHLRIGAIILFSATLLKLFFYDLSSLDTISKTIVFIVLGILLLVISFLYTKYKKMIFDDREG